MSVSLIGVHVGVGGDVADVNRVVHPEVADVNLDRARNLRRQTLELDLAVHEVEHAAFDLHAARLALDDDLHGDLDAAIHVDAQEVRVQQVARNRIEQVTP